MTATPPVIVAVTVSFKNPIVLTLAFQYDISANISKSTTCRPPRHTLCLDLDQLHPRVRRGAIVSAVLEITKPRTRHLRVHLFDPRILVRRCRRHTRDGDPVLVRRVLECDSDVLVGRQVLELLAVRIGQEQEVRPASFCDRHRASDGADIWPVSDEQADLELVDRLVELVPLLRLWRLVVPLLGDSGVGLRVDLLGF